MTLFEVTDEALSPVAKTDYSAEKITERYDLQRLLLRDLSIIETGLLPICEEFSPWQDSDRRIDIFALDKRANLVVIELKRTKDGGHMDLQALRYAAMVSTLSFEDVVTAHAAFLGDENNKNQARNAILKFLGLDTPNEADFGADVRIYLVSADFSKEVTTTVLWLNQRGLDIRCIRLKPYKYDGKILIDVQPIIPLPEAEEYQVRVKEKEQQRRRAISRRKSMQEIRELIAAMPERHRRTVNLVEKELASLGYVPFATADGLAWNLRTNEQKHFFLKFIPKDPDRPALKDHKISLWFKVLTIQPPFDSPQAQEELYRLFCMIPKLALTRDKLASYPDYSMDVIESDEDIQALLTALRWVVNMFNKHQGNAE